MIKVLIDFFDKKTEKHVFKLRMDFPDDMVFSAAKKEDANELALATSENKQIDYINCRPFDVTDEMKKYAIEHYPELKEKFDLYLHEFIGRQGLPENY